MSQPTENRRIIAVDDDQQTLEHYQRILVGKKQRTDVAGERLLGMLEGGLDKESSSAGEREPYQLDCFAQGEVAVAALEQGLHESKPYTVALIDMRMLPGIDGFETARRMRDLDRDLFIVFVTAYSDYSTDELYKQLSGAVLWFRKPFHSEEIYQVVRNCCTSWNQARQLQQLKESLADRVDLQTQRLEKKMQSVAILEKNVLGREQQMSAMKQEMRILKAYQDLRLLLQQKPLPDPLPLQSDTPPVDLLLVDDSPTVRAINKVKLEQFGFKVRVAESVDEAFQTALNHPPEVALIDYYMPGGNGDKLISLLRSDPHTLHILPLLFTNAGDEMMAVEAGAVYWMTKDQEELLQKMELVRDYIQSNRSFQTEQLQSAQSTDNRHVLLVDDEQSGLDQLYQLFNSDPVVATGERVNDFELRGACSGEQAIERVREAQLDEHPFAMMLIRQQMANGMDGVECARQIRQISPYIDIVLIGEGGSNPVTTMRKVLGNNFSFLRRPLEHDVVLQRVIEGCARWDMVHEINASHHALLNLSDDIERESALRTELDQLLEEAQQASKAKDDFLASMSHELRTPLTSIIGNSALLLDGNNCGADRCTQDNAEQIIQSINIAARSQLALVNDILDMSKIESGKFDTEESPYDLQVLLADIRRLFSLQVQETGLAFTIEQKNREEMMLLGDGQRIGQILINLVNNALKFTEKGEVALISEVSGNEIVFKVIDTGIGMSPEIVSKMFTRFEQADNSISRRYGGSGLGLFISKTLAELMEGTIEVSSEEHVGSTFTVRLPYKVSDVAARSEQGSLTQSILNERFEGHALIAEDTPLLQQLERRILEGLGLTVTIVDDGEKAVAAATGHAFDIILMDMQMPIMDGIEATRKLREGGCATPIIAVTANVMPKHRTAFEEAGCDSFLGKPFDEQELKMILSRYLKNGAEALESERRVRKERRKAIPVIDTGRRIGLRRSVDSPNSAPAPAPDPSKREAVVNDEMMAEFYQDLSAKKERLITALSEGDLSAVGGLSHAIKGYGTPFGFPQLSEKGKLVCDAMDNDQLERVPLLAEALIVALEQLVQ